MRHAEEFQRLGLNRAQGILLAGPPGCGKTLLAKVSADTSLIDYLAVHLLCSMCDVKVFIF